MLKVVDGHLRTKVTETILDKYTCISIINFICIGIFKIMVGILIVILRSIICSKGITMIGLC